MYPQTNAFLIYGPVTGLSRNRREKDKILPDPYPDLEKIPDRL